MANNHLKSYESWLRYQKLPDEVRPAEVEASLRQAYEEAVAAARAVDVTDVVKRPPRPGEYLYAVAIEDDEDLWLTLWVRRKRNGECFVFWPRGSGRWMPHASYHGDGRSHWKSYNRITMPVRRLQRPEGFRGAEHLGYFSGHGTGIALCYPEAFTSIMRVPAGILETARGAVIVDLVEPGKAPPSHHHEVPGMRPVLEQTFEDCMPWTVITVAESTRR